MKKVATDPTDYLDSLDQLAQEDMKWLDGQISKIMVGQERILWEGVFWGGSEQNIIGYGAYNYDRPGGKKVEWFKIGLALQKNYISLYINAVEDGQYVTKTYEDELGKVKIGKSSVSFKSLDGVNKPQLLRLLQHAAKLMQ